MIISGRPLDLPGRYYHTLIIDYVTFTRSIVDGDGLDSQTDSFTLYIETFGKGEFFLDLAGGFFQTNHPYNECEEISLLDFVAIVH